LTEDDKQSSDIASPEKHDRLSLRLALESVC
jgi:hypothetical protein